VNERDDWSSIAYSLSTNALKFVFTGYGSILWRYTKENKNVKKRKLVLKNQRELSHAGFISYVS